jgi:AcrR family transcriptional regulator
MSIQDVLDEVGASRGAFYHYFDSKAALLEAVVERTADGVMAAIAPVADDPDLPAVAKLQAVFVAAGRWKAQRRDLMLALLRAWYSDDNAIVREHLRRETAVRLTPLLAAIVRQGAAEGAFHVTSPAHAAAVIVALFLVAGDTTSQLFLDRLAGRVPYEHVRDAVAAHDEAIERVLGLGPGSFELIDEPAMRFWFDTPG